jgi:SlyX protein
MMVVPGTSTAGHGPPLGVALAVLPDNAALSKLKTSDMTAPAHDDIERRLVELEVKASFADDLLDRLNEVVARQQRQIDLLIEELRALRAQVAAAEPATARSLRDELPPHF